MRRQLPAYSPVSGRALAGALRDAARPDARVLDRARALIGQRFRTDHVLLADTGRSALQLAIAVGSDARRSDTVALPAFQCFEVASAAVGAGVRIALYDVDPRTLAPDADSLNDALRRAGVAVIAPLYGVPVDWDAVIAIAHAHGAILIEDAAQGHGASWRGAPLGALGSLSVLSFGRGKGWTAGGGGALLARGDEQLIERVRNARAELEQRQSRGMRAAAASFAQWLVGRPSLYGIPSMMPGLGLGETIYHRPREPAAMAAFSAALLIRTHDASEREASVRLRQVAEWMSVLPESLRAGIPSSPQSGRAGYCRLPIVLDAPLSPGDWPHLRHAGAMPSYPAPLSDLADVRARLVAGPTRFSGAEALASRLITLPTHSRVDARDRDAIAHHFANGDAGH